MDPTPPSSSSAASFHRIPPPKDVDPPRQRIDVACQRCRRRKIKCSGWTEEQQRCLGCIKADHPCEFVNRPSPIVVPPSMSHSPQTTITSAGYGRPWSPSSQNYTPSPRTHSAHGSMSGSAHRRSTLGYQPYPPQISPTTLGSYSPSYVTGHWMPQQLEVMETYTGTGFHHLLDQPSSIGGRQSQPRPEDMGLMQAPENISQSTLAQRRLQRGGSYTYGEQGSPPIQSSVVASRANDYMSPSLIPRDEAYGGLIYQPIPTQQIQARSMSAVNLRTGGPQLQSHAASSHSAPPYSPQTSEHSQSAASTQGFVSPQSAHQQPLTSSPQQDHSHLQYDPQYDPQLYQDTAHRTRPYPSEPHQSTSQYPPKFAVPSSRRPNLPDQSSSTSTSSPGRRPTLSDTLSKASSTSVLTSFTSTTQTTQSSHPEYPYPTHPYKPLDQESSDSGNLTPQTLADHTQVHEELHEQHVDNAKNALSVDNGNDVEVIEYLETLPVPNVPTHQTRHE